MEWTDGKMTSTGSQTYLADGTMTLKMDNGYTDAGTWTIKGKGLCSHWSKQPPHPGPCDPLYDLGEGKMLWQGKGQHTTISP